MVKGKPIDDVKQMVEAFIRMLTRDTLSKEDAAILGKLVVFEGVKQYPVRVKCATLIWRAIEGALESEKAIDVISTE
jgi:nitrogen fixation protein NifU and related proteins